MLILNVSSPAITAGSDSDNDIILSELGYDIVVKVLSSLHIGKQVRENTYRIAVSNREYFIYNVIDEQTKDLHYNLIIMNNWSADKMSAYKADKALIAHLTGNERLLAKIELAKVYNLRYGMYTWKVKK